jgi:hypothetical protein
VVICLALLLPSLEHVCTTCLSGPRHPVQHRSPAGMSALSTHQACAPACLLHPATQRLSQWDTPVPTHVALQGTVYVCRYYPAGNIVTTEFFRQNVF